MSNEAVALTKNDYKVADIALADWGRREIAIAETEMPGSWPCARNTRAGSRLTACA